MNGKKNIKVKSLKKPWSFLELIDHSVELCSKTIKGRRGLTGIGMTSKDADKIGDYKSEIIALFRLYCLRSDLIRLANYYYMNQVNYTKSGVEKLIHDAELVCHCEIFHSEIDVVRSSLSEIKSHIESNADWWNRRDKITGEKTSVKNNAAAA